MRCDRCGKDYPSRYYFRTRTICDNCFQKMSPEEQKRALEPSGVERLTSTTFTIEGYSITKSFGLVRGITVRSRSIFGTIGASLQTIIGGNITLFTELWEKTRAEAFELMVQHAEDEGANAVVGVRYDANEVMGGVTEVLCYGTADVVEPTRN